MVTLHWILEYAAVFCGYIFLMFVWPTVVFHKHLAEKSKIYWFGFCAVAQMVLINTVVLTFGLLHILNKWTIIAFFYGIFFLVILRRVKFDIGKIEELSHLVKGIYGKKRLLFRAIHLLGAWIRKQGSKLWGILYPHLGEYIALSILLIFGMIYFSYGAFQDHSYGFSDMYIHHSWIYGLVEGKVFSAGIYPEAMHCFVYCLHTLFGISIYSIMLFVGGIHIAVLLLSIYLLLREVFHWSYTPLFMLALFLTLDLALPIFASYKTLDAVLARLQCALPQDFGMYTQFLCALFLIRYLKYAHEVVRKEKVLKFYWDKNLLLFTMAIAASISIHFYATIMAVFICIAVAVCAIRKVFSRKRFVPLAAAALCGFLIAALPMAGALASGIQFQSSINWALGVMQETGNDETQEQETKSTEKKVLSESPEKKDTAIKSVIRDKIDWGKKLFVKLYTKGYCGIYGAERAEWGKWAAIFTGVSAALWLVFRLTAIVLKRIFKRKVNGECFDRYPGMILASVLFVLLYIAPTIGLPELIEAGRLGPIAHVLLLAVILMPIDMLFSLLARYCKQKILQGFSVLCIIGIYIGTNYLNIYHGYLNYELTRYNAAVMVTESIIETFPQYSYTLVSPTDELYHVIECGRHEELLTFVRKSRETEEYTLPTQYVFLYIEKRPLYYGQYHFFGGPSWLATERKRKDYPVTYTSYCPAIRTSSISQEAAQKELNYAQNWEAYRVLNERTIVESKAYEWCERFSEIYPLELNVYYEDDDFVCYYFKQEPHAPYNLAIKQ